MNDPGRALRETGPPDPAAEDRAWRLARAAYLRHPVTRRSARPRRGLLVVVAATIVAVLALSSAGGSVVSLVRQIGSSSKPPTAQMPNLLRSLPGGGQLLAIKSGSAYVLRSGAAPRRLGHADEATFSAFGHYAALADGHRLAVYALDGRRVWTLSEVHRVDAIRWSPDGLRVAYRAGTLLRIVDGNGERPRTLAATAGAALAWRPGPEPVISYVGADHQIAMTDVSTGDAVGHIRANGAVRQLAWSSDGTRLIALSATRLRIFDRRGIQIAERHAPASGGRFVGTAFAPGTHRLAVLVRRPGRDVVSVDNRTVAEARRLGRPIWSPDARRLIVTTSTGALQVITGLSSAAGPRTRSASAWGSVSDWCCAPRS